MNDEIEFDIEADIMNAEVEAEFVQEQIDEAVSEWKARADSLAAEVNSLNEQLAEALRCDRIHTSDYESERRQRLAIEARHADLAVEVGRLRAEVIRLRERISTLEETEARADALVAQVERLRENNAALQERLNNESVMAFGQTIVLDVLADPALNQSIGSIVYNAGINENDLKEMWSQMTIMGLIQFVPGTEIPIPVPWAREMIREIAALRTQLVAQGTSHANVSHGLAVEVARNYDEQIGVLQAQLAAAGGWHGFDKKPADGQTVVVRAVVKAIYYADDDVWQEISDYELDAWQVLLTQTET